MSMATQNIDDLFIFYSFEIFEPKKVDPLCVGNFIVNHQCKEVIVNGDRIQLRGDTYKTFLAIFKRAGDFISYEDLLQEVFGDKKTHRHSSWVSVSIHRLRNIFGEDVVLTEYKKGYKLNLNYGRRT